MKNIINKVTEDFDIKKNYKIFRFFQKLLNPTINKKKKYKDVVVNLDNRKLKVRLFSPFKDKEKHKVLILIHGGGWMSGSLDSYTNLCYDLSKKTHHIVIAIGYRLAPEYPFPAGFDDCYDVTKFIYDNAKIFNIDTKDITLIGDSAGGNLCAAVNQKALDTKEFKIKKQILIYPAVQTDYSLNTSYKSVIEKGSNYIITRTQLCDFINTYIVDKENLKNKYVSPILSKNMFGLPETLIILAEDDPLHDEGLAYAKKLKRHLVKVKYYTFTGATHGFLTNILDRKYTNMAFEKINIFLGDKNGS